MGKDFLLTVVRPDRMKIFQHLFGKHSIRIESMIPIAGHTPEGLKEFYKVDPEELTPEVRARWIEAVAKKFQQPEEDVSEVPQETGYVIDSEGCIATLMNPQRWG